MTTPEIKGSVRPRAGKGAARLSRRDGLVPAVIYGDGQPPTTIAVDQKELTMAISKGRFSATLFDINLDGEKHRVIPRDVQLHPVKDQPVHVDFQRVGAKSRIRVAVPTRFINETASPGLKRGGVLNVVRHLIEVTCPADTIPAEFVFDLTGLEIGRSIHISATHMPEGVRPTIVGRDFTVATIAGAVADDAEKTATADGDAAAAAPAAAGDAKGAAPAGKAAAPAGKGAAPAGKGAAPAGKGAAPAAKAPAKK